MFGNKDTRKVGKNVPSGSENPFKAERERRGPGPEGNLGECILSGLDLCYKHLIGRYSLVKSSHSEKLVIVRYLRATPKFEFMEVSIDGGEPIWVQPYPTGLHVDYGCDGGNYTVKFVYDEEKDFVTEKVPLESTAIA